MMNSHDPERVETIVEKVEYIEECLEILVRKQPIEKNEYIHDQETRDIVERRFEKMTTACLDIARMLLKDIDGRAPNSNAATMELLGKNEILSEQTTESMAQAALFRNVLAHEYGEVLDQEIVYKALQDLRRYRQFLHQVRVYLEEQGAI